MMRAVKRWTNQIIHRRIRDDERAAGRPGIPIVAVTASQPEECEPLCRNAGCTGLA